MNTIDKYGDELTAAKIIDGSIDEFIDDKITNIKMGIFAFCSQLKIVDLPLLSSLPFNAFSNCKSLSAINLPLIKVINNGAFARCENLLSVNFPSARIVSDAAFDTCSKMTTVFLESCTLISYAAFTQCKALESFYLLGSSVPQLTNSGAFFNTPLYSSSYLDRYGSIFVRASLLSDYQSATNWAFYSERFVGLTDEQIAALDNE